MGLSALITTDLAAIAEPLKIEMARAKESAELLMFSSKGKSLRNDVPGVRNSCPPPVGLQSALSVGHRTCSRSCAPNKKVTKTASILDRPAQPRLGIRCQCVLRKGLGSRRVTTPPGNWAALVKLFEGAVAATKPFGAFETTSTSGQALNLLWPGT
jgi:hypothetical protein